MGLFDFLFDNKEDTTVEVDMSDDIRSTNKGQILHRNSIVGDTVSMSIRNALLAYGPLTSDDIEFVTGRPHQTISARLAKMRDRGSVRLVGEYDFTRHGVLAQRQRYVTMLERN